MTDKALYIGARLAWPLATVALMLLVGRVYGQDGLAGYTFALSVVAPLFFLASFSMPMFLGVRIRNGRARREILATRIVSAIVSIPIVFGIAMFFQPVIAALICALWLMRVGDLFYETTTILIVTDQTDTRRGARLFAIEVCRAGVVVFLFWQASQWGGVPLTGVVAICGMTSALAGLIVIVVLPKWVSRHIGRASLVATLRRLGRACAPMSISGALLALLCNMPRLLVEGELQSGEGATFGIAQAASGGLALVFHSLWMYDLGALNRLARSGAVAEVVRCVARLTFTFLGILAIATVILMLGQGVIFMGFGIDKASDELMPVLFAALTLQHSISINRDALKLFHAYWAEVKVLLCSICVAGAGYLVMRWTTESTWLFTVVAIVCLGAMSQVIGARVVIAEEAVRAARPEAQE